MRRSFRTPLVFAGIVALAVALRAPGLDIRPMHADEAVHAAKMGALLEQGRYEYDPSEYHGPTLNYLTLLPARLRGAARYQDLDERTLRSVPVAMGVLLVAAHVLLVPVVGFWAAAVAALLAALSPALVFYSRYYIQETLLLAFSFGALVSICRYLRAPRMRWAVSAGACVGLMWATKETWVIAFGCLVAALLLAFIYERWSGASSAMPARSPGRHIVAAGAAAVVVSALFFSSFLGHPSGVLDAASAYGTYLQRASGHASWHAHPWHYYLGLLLYSRSGGGPVWTEAAIVALALVGLVGVTRRRTAAPIRTVPVLLGAYAVLMVVAYSAIPYKTPWCLLGFLHALILLAGIGVVYLHRALGNALARTALLVLLSAASVHLGRQAWTGSFRYSSDPRNPYVYAHTGTGVFEITRRVEALAGADPRRYTIPIEIVSRQNLWPLPWYLRRFSGLRWETALPADRARAPVILATPEMEPAVVRQLYEARLPGQRELYMNIFDVPVDLRPQIEIRGYAAKTLWDEYRQSQR